MSPRTTAASGAALLGIAGALFLPAGVANAQPAAPTASVRAVAQVTTLPAAVPAGRSKAQGSGSSSTDQNLPPCPGGSVCWASLASKSAASGTGSSDKASTSGGLSLDKIITDGTALLSKALDFGIAGAGAVTSLAKIVQPGSQIGDAVGGIISGIAKTFGGH